jgi:hypothetical protein
MNKNLKIFVVASVLIVGIYFITKKKKEEPVLAEYMEDDVVSSPNTISVTPKQNTKPDWDKILKLGSKGIEVKTLQKALKQVDVDGDFGVGTQKRLKSVTGFNQISINQYNDYIKNKPVVKKAPKIVPKIVPKKEVVAQTKPTTSFTTGLITTL